MRVARLYCLAHIGLLSAIFCVGAVAVTEGQARTASKATEVVTCLFTNNTGRDGRLIVMPTSQFGALYEVYDRFKDELIRAVVPSISARNLDRGEQEADRLRHMDSRMMFWLAATFKSSSFDSLPKGSVIFDDPAHPAEIYFPSDVYEGDKGTGALRALGPPPPAIRAAIVRRLTNNQTAIIRLPRTPGAHRWGYIFVAPGSTIYSYPTVRQPFLLEGAVVTSGRTHLVSPYRDITRTFTNRTNRGCRIEWNGLATIKDGGSPLDRMGATKCVYLSPTSSVTCVFLDVPKSDTITFYVGQARVIQPKSEFTGAIYDPSVMGSIEYTSKFGDDGTTVITDGGITNDTGTAPAPADVPSGKRAEVASDIAAEMERDRSHANSLPPLTTVEMPGGNRVTASWEVTNHTGVPITILITGPEQRKVVLPSGEHSTLDLKPGSYELLVKSSSANLVPLYGMRTLGIGYRYASDFVVRPSGK